VAAFRRAGGTEFELLLGRRSVGKWLPAREEWAIRVPYRLVIDVRSLPRPVSSGEAPVAAEGEDG